MKNFVTAQNKMRIRDLREKVRNAKNSVEGIMQLRDREQNPEKVMMLDDQIQQKCGIIESMENQISMLEGRKK